MLTGTLQPSTETSPRARDNYCRPTHCLQAGGADFAETRGCAAATRAEKDKTGAALDSMSAQQGSVGDLTSSVLQLRILGDEDGAAKPQTLLQSRQPKHSPLVMTPGGSFTKAKSRSSFSPGDDDEELDEEGEDGEEGEGVGLGSQDLSVEAAASSPVSPEQDAQLEKEAPPPQPLQFQQVGLFGGAITTALPAAFEDVSTIRQVPDHQEVFVDRNSEMSFIVELVAYSAEVSNVNAPGYYFSDLAECNEAKNVTVDSSAVVSDAGFAPLLSDKALTKCAITGRQTVSKFRKDDAPLEVVQIVLVVIRLPHVGTDLLLSVNVPFVEGVPPLRVQDILPVAESNTVGVAQCPAARVIAEAVRQLNVRNWSLFA